VAITVDEVRQIFSYLESGSGDQFFEHVADNVDWTVQGTHPLAGHYTSKQDFISHTFARLNKILPGGTQLQVQNILIDENWVVVELQSLATAKNGMRFNNHYCWVMRFEDKTIVEVRAYLDSALVKQVIDENNG